MEWNTDPKVEAEILEKYGLETFINAEATAEVYERAFGEHVEGPTVYVADLKPTTEGALDKAEAAVQHRMKVDAAAAVVPKRKRFGLSALNKQLKADNKAEADEMRRSTMVIPSSVVKPHASAPAKRPAEGPSSSTAAAKKVRR